MNALARHARILFRGLARRPGYTLTAMLTLAVGIGASTAIFSVVQGALLRPLQYPHRDIADIDPSLPVFGVTSMNDVVLQSIGPRWFATALFTAFALIALAGLAIGVLGAVLALRLLARLLYQVQPADPLTLAVVAAVALLTALAASYLPARKAASVEPMKVLREE